MKPVFDPQSLRASLRLLTAGSLLCLSACGGGGAGGGLSVSLGGGSGGGIGGTGLTSSGTINGTGSIFVNGVRFDVDDADIFIDGEVASEDELGLGMVVTVSGTVEDDAENGVADRVDYDPQLEGPVSSIERNADNSGARLKILGQTVIIERTSTVFEDTSFAGIAPGDVLEVSGYVESDGQLRATRIAGEDDSGGAVKVSGIISDLQDQTFRIGTQQIDAAGAVIDDLPDNVLENGLFVEVEGELIDGVVQASEVEGRSDLGSTLEVDDEIVAEGPLSNFDGATGFTLEGLEVDASTATINSGGLPLDDGLIVEVRGVWDGSRLVADEVNVRRGRIEIEAPLTAIDGNTLTFQFANEELTVVTDNRTLFDDDRDDIKFLKIGDLAIGDFLAVEALDAGTSLLATRVDRDETDDDTMLQAPVQSFVEGVSVTILGITFDLTQAEFENAGDDDISSELFFANLNTGALVSVEDDNPSDGFAESIEFEFATALVGEREFEDDDEERIGEDDLPPAVLAYLANNFPAASIAFSKRDDDEIEVYLTNGTEVVFDLNGSFLESDEEDEKDEEDDDEDDRDDLDEDDESDEDDSDDDDDSDEADVDEDEDDDDEDEDDEDEDDID